MPGTLTFPINAELKAVIDHAVKTKSTVAFVKDQGVYLCSFTPQGQDNLVSYAKGLNPDVDNFDSWWERANRVCGGDDFCERLDPSFFDRAIKSGKKSVKIKMSKTRMTLEA